jgi:predicted transposase YdaD
VYNTVLDEKYDLPVQSGVVLLRPEADSPALTGEYCRQVEGRPPHSLFRYDVVRVWTLSPERLLAGGLGTMPLAPVSAVADADVPSVIGRMKERLTSRVARPLARDLWAATFVLLGLRHTSEMAAVLLRGVVTMKESTTYQMIVEEGRALGLVEGRREGTVQALRGVVRRLGESRLGPPDKEAQAALDGISDPARLEELTLRVLTATSWRELLGLPGPRRRSRRRPES